MHSSPVAPAGTPHLWPVSCDYRDAAAFTAALAAAARERGPLRLALCWIRSTAPQALAVVADSVADGGRIVHALGSAGRNPSTLGSDVLRRQHRIRYQRVLLGFVVEQGRSRWLTDAEISAGALAAVDDPDTDPYVVGQVEPWSAHP